MITLLTGITASEIWRQAFTRMQDTGEAPSDAQEFARELLHAVFSLEDPRQRWVNVRLPAMNPALAIAEVVWILNKRNDAAFLNYWCRQLKQFAGDSYTYRGAYGHRLRAHFGLDQLERAYRALSANRRSRQVVLQIWDPSIDLPDEGGKPTDADIPCNVVSMLKVRNDRLEWTQVVRSNDLFRGLPYNLIQYTTLQEIMAGWLGLGLGSYNQISDSLHLYTREANMVSVEDNDPTAPNTDSLMLPKDESDRVLRTMEMQLERMSGEPLTVDDLHALLDTAEVPAAYRNLLAVMGAECARRRMWYDAISACIASCTNLMLRCAWERWEARMMPKAIIRS